MKRWLLALLTMVCVSVALADVARPVAEDPVLEARLMAISEELRCLVCQNESLAGSRADLANDLRREIRSLLREGRSDQEILDFMVGRYGDFVRYRPPVKATTWLLWAGPFMLLTGGVTALVIFLRKRGRQRLTPPLSAEDRRRAETLLASPQGEAPAGDNRS